MQLGFVQIRVNINTKNREIFNFTTNNIKVQIEKLKLFKMLWDLGTFWRSLAKTQLELI